MSLVFGQDTAPEVRKRLLAGLASMSPADKLARIEVQGAHLDLEALRSRAAALGLRDLVRRALSEAAEDS